MEGAMRPSSSTDGVCDAAGFIFPVEGELGPCQLAELRARAAAHGAQALAELEALTLFLARPAGRAAAVYAGRLLARFGSLPEALGAPRTDLAQVVPAKVALEIELLHDLHGRALQAPLRQRELLTRWSQVADYLRCVLAAEPREQFRALFLDKRNRLIADEVLGRGTVDHAPVYPREVARRALELNASAVVLAHNHPSGDGSPSSADVEMTRQVVDALRVFRIAVHDHLLVAGDQVVSFKTRGLL
jgi:DNA repair protein RadC